MKNNSINIIHNVFTGFVSAYLSDAIKVAEELYDGKMVYQTAKIIGNKIFLPSHLSKGMYVFKIITAGETVTKKLIKG